MIRDSGPVVALVGNPNTGKTTLFNALTGLRQHVGNYAGVTVDVKFGRAVVPDSPPFEVVDVPGAYSLSPRSPDEMLAIELLLGLRPQTPAPDVVVCVLDAANLERNMYMATQVLEIGLPTIVALNMMDVASRDGLRIDVELLSQRLGAVVVPIQADRRVGLRELAAAVHQVHREHSGVAGISEKVEDARPPKATLQRMRVPFPEPFGRLTGELSAWIEARQPTMACPRFLAERLLLDVDGETQQRFHRAIGEPLLSVLANLRKQLQDAGLSLVGLEPQVRYQWISNMVREAVHKPAMRRATWTDRLDALLLHRVWGLLAFFGVMAAFFWTVFAVSPYMQEPIEQLGGNLGAFVSTRMPEGALRSLLVDGVIAGAFSVLVFLPQIVLLFGMLAVLEDCGYMARAAFLMDRFLAPCGLSGKSFIPMLSSFACAVPGVMAARTIEDPRDRLATILVAPLMSCSARLPVYTLLVDAFVEGALQKTLTMVFLYSLGLILAPLVAFILRRTLLRGESNLFLMELPPYKRPNLISVLMRMWDRGGAFLKRASTLIVAAAIIVWALTYYPRSSEVAERFASEEAEIDRRAELLGEKEEDVAAARRDFERRLATAYQEQSWLGRMGRFIEPAVEPLGWDWKIGMAAIASFPAREVVLAALNTIYSVGDDDEDGNKLSTAMKAEKRPDGRPRYDFAVALSIMVFFALCCQCVSTLVVILRETRSWGWTLFAFTYMTVLAYIGALVAYQVSARFLGTA